MKINYPKKKKSIRVDSKNPKIKKMLFLLFFLGAFFGGMLIYRSGYPSMVLENVRSILAQDEDAPEVSEALTDAIEDVNTAVSTELGLYQSNGLPTVFLDVPFDSMMQIEEKREEALDVGILLTSDDDYVPANMHFNDEQNLDIKMRLKGDLSDHLQTDKWSFRIHIKEDDGAVLGMRRFSLQSPETRNFVNEWGYHQNMMLEDILTTRYHFVNVVINGDNKGIYALEEHFSEDLLESQKRREGVIIRFDEDDWWVNRANFTEGDDESLWNMASAMGLFETTTSASSEIIPYRGQRVTDSETLNEELKTAIDLLNSLLRGDLPPEQVLDVELWGKYYAITDLWMANHSPVWHNERFYYNPNTGLLEPVVFDGVAMHPHHDRDQLAFNFPNFIFALPGVQKVYVETLEQIASEEYLNRLQDEFGEEFEGYNSLIAEEYEEELALPWEKMNLRREIINKNLNSAQPIRGNYHLVKKNGKTFLKLDLVNLMVLPMQINDLLINDESYDFDSAWFAEKEDNAEMLQELDETILLSGRKNGFSPLSFYIPTEVFSEIETTTNEVALNVQLYGASESINIPLYTNYVPQDIESGVKPTATLEESLRAHPFLVVLSNNQIAIKPGDWSVESDLIIPENYNITIPAGTTLRFADESVFLIYGNIDIKGTEETPVLLTAQNESWGGMVVLNAPEESIWQYANVEKMTGISRDGWILTGGITFYESPIEISHSVIGNNTSEDALNVIRTTFSFEYVEFQNTPSDAFDGDFTTGTASYCSFHDIGGDAFDVSGTEATIVDSYFVNIVDKAISAGEKSEIIASNITIRNVGIGVASKDLSSVQVDAATIDSANVAGLAVYIKKPQYGPASLEATNTEILNTEIPAFCQTDNELLLNGEYIQPEDVDVDALYAKE